MSINITLFDKTNVKLTLNSSEYNWHIQNELIFLKNVQGICEQKGKGFNFHTEKLI